MTPEISRLLEDAHLVLTELVGLGVNTKNEIATNLVKVFISNIERDPNANGLGLAAYSLSWHLADQYDPLPNSNKIAELSTKAQRLSKLLTLN
ncbi:MAG: hypothetical protein NT013_09380 [Planctomycetia bacterium]|nr:hypothetical protein [Planctomycetia bacterium]